MELDEAETEEVEPFGVDTAKQLFSMEGRGRLIWRNRRKNNAQVSQQQPGSVGYITVGRPED